MCPSIFFLMKKIDLTGQTFGSLTILYEVPDKWKRSRWMCRCECGKLKQVDGRHMRRGLSKSCGCKIGNPNCGTHHQARRKKKTRTYSSWLNMKNRCLNPRCEAFHHYGGRGITVCERWLHSFENFREDMGDCPIGYSIERSDNNKGYSKENCLWIPKGNQSSNRRNTIRVSLDGTIMMASEAARLLGVKECFFLYRYHKYGPDEAIRLSRLFKIKSL